MRNETLVKEGGSCQSKGEETLAHPERETGRFQTSLYVSGGSFAYSGERKAR